MNPSCEETWRTTADPRALLRLTRKRPSGRKYLLLACAVVRRFRSVPPVPYGGWVLDALERFAVTQPARRVTTDVWRGVIAPIFPEVRNRLSWTDPRFGADAGWLWALSGHLPALSRVRAAVVNVALDAILRAERRAASAAAAREAQELADRLIAEAVRASPPVPTGWFGWVYGWGRARGREVAGLPVYRYHHEILALLPPEKRERWRWPAWQDVPGPGSARAWGQHALTAERVERRLGDVNRGAAGLIREVFGNPFRAAAFRAEWREANFGTAGRVAEHIAATGNYSDVPILADALEDAGCDDEELLAHCRAGEHVPGCWVVDAARGRT